MYAQRLEADSRRSQEEGQQYAPFPDNAAAGLPPPEVNAPLSQKGKLPRTPLLVMAER